MLVAGQPEYRHQGTLTDEGPLTGNLATKLRTFVTF